MTTTFKDTSSQITVKFNISERIDQHNDNTSVQLPGIFNVIKLHVQQRNIYIQFLVSLLKIGNINSDSWS